ncbi:MAG: T9SS type A sorting domain-containing protein [Bacteroidales bacterium]|nr:T9SS type A sorting domain-containing protein [Bacteroidales bacterium]
MKQKILLIAILLLSISISFSQSESFEKYITDTDGKIYYSDTEKEISEIIDKNKLNKNLIRNLSIIWNNEDYDISDNQNADSWDPRIDVGADGTLYVVYNDNHEGTGLQKIMFRKKEPAGDWTEPIYIDKGGVIGARNNHFPAVAVSPNGDIHSMYNVWAFENYRNFIGYSFYDASEDLWSDGVEISEAGGSVSSHAHHDIYSTDNNLPVVIWGFDNRENEDYEEIYMKYYDGTTWSSDIIVSTASDNLSATYPYMVNIGNNKAMIIFNEETSNLNEQELRYRIYDETTHTLTDIQSVPQTQYNTDNSNSIIYDISKKDDENAIIAIWQNPNFSPFRDTIKCINYNILNEEFAMSEHKFISETDGNFPKYLSVDCDLEGNCAIIYTDTYLKTCNFIEFDSVSGFSEAQVFNSEDLIDSPECKFDSDGNLHVVWPDLRFDIPGGYVEREVFYEKGTNIENIYTVTFTVDDGTVPIDGAEIAIGGGTYTTTAGEVAIDLEEGNYTYTVTAVGFDDFTDTYTVTADAGQTVAVHMTETISVKNLIAVGISIYPNPSDGVFNINVENNFNLEVFDITGKIINTQALTGSSTIEINNAGVYFLRFSNNETTVVQRVIVK